MTARSGDIEERLAESVRQAVSAGRADRTVYELLRPPRAVLVVETERAGEAQVECSIPEACMCIHWKLGTGLFGFLQSDKNADGSLFFCRPDGSVEAHVIECKKTVDQTKWADVLEQMRWTLCKLMALAGVLGVRIERVVLGTAYRRDLLSGDESPNPASARRPIGPPAEQSPDERELNHARRQQLAWMDDKLRLRGFEPTFPHVKIKLDPTTGRGSYPA